MKLGIVSSDEQTRYSFTGRTGFSLLFAKPDSKIGAEVKQKGAFFMTVIERFLKLVSFDTTSSE